MTSFFLTLKHPTGVSHYSVSKDLAAPHQKLELSALLVNKQW